MERCINPIQTLLKIQEYYRKNRVVMNTKFIQELDVILKDNISASILLRNAAIYHFEFGNALGANPIMNSDFNPIVVNSFGYKKYIDAIRLMEAMLKSEYSEVVAYYSNNYSWLLYKLNTWSMMTDEQIANLK